MTPLCNNYIFKAFDPTAKTALQIVGRNSIRDFQSLRQKGWFHRTYLVRLALPLLSQQDISPREIYLVSKVDQRASSVGYTWKSFASFLNCEPGHCQHESSIFCLGLQPNGKKLWTKRTKFCFMNHDASNDSPGGNMVTKWKPWGFLRTISLVFVEAIVLFSTSGVFSSRAVHIRSRTYL
jgi:hypothetical protein